MLIRYLKDIVLFDFHCRRSVFDEDTKRLESLNTPSSANSDSASIKTEPQFNFNSTSLSDTTTKPTMNATTTSVASASILRSTTDVGGSSGSSSKIPQSPAVRPFKPTCNTAIEIKNEPQSAPAVPLPRTTVASTASSMASVSRTSSTAFPFSASTTKCTTSTAFNSNAVSTPSGTMVRPSTTPTVGQVKPVSSMTTAVASAGVVKATPLPHAPGSSTTTVPIKPLSDKSRALSSTKPSATVTPTFKSSAASHQSQSGLRRNSSLTTTTTTCTRAVSSCTTTATSGKSTVEKGEASSTTSSPKIEQPLGAVLGKKKFCVNEIGSVGKFYLAGNVCRKKSMLFLLF